MRSQLHNGVYLPHLQNAYRKVMGAPEGNFTGIERAGETITPVVDLWTRAEWAQLRDETLWAAYHEVAAVAGELSFVGIRNPAGSNVICVITGMTAHPTVGAATAVRTFHGAIVATDVDGAEQIVPRDTRYPLAGATALFKIHGTGVAAIGNDALHRITIPIDAQIEDLTQWVITPGFEQRYYVQTANVAGQIAITGYLRIEERGELSAS